VWIGQQVQALSRGHQRRIDGLIEPSRRLWRNIS